jgi:hypothetical protein
MLAVVFIGLTTYQNLAHADELGDHKRKLEYLELKEVLESDLELLQAQIKNKTLQIKKLDSDYKDVVTTAPKEQTVSPQSKPVSESEKVEAVTLVEDEKREWVVTNVNGGTCPPWKIDKGSLDISKDGTFSWVARNIPHNWEGTYSGNLRDSTAKCSPCRNNARVADFESEQIDGHWKIRLKMSWGGRSCRISFNLE